MMRYFFLILLYFLNLIILKSQGENDNWIFGNGCNISFASGNPVVLPSLSSLKTKEGCTSVSDKDGKLLFYSDGIKIWNADHDLMPDGEGLLGNPSSTSSCVIVPYPGHLGMYYVFCVEPNVSSKPRASYNVVDLSLNNGKGGLVLKNKILFEFSDEKIAVTRHCNGREFWIVLHRAMSDTYVSYLLSSNGLSTSPVKSIIKQSNGKNIELGFLKFSPEGKYLADARCLARKLLIHKFNTTSGKVSAYVSDDNSWMPLIEGQTYYGIAFSANSENLYATCLDQGYLFQYDLEQDSSKIAPSRTLLHEFRRRIGAMQLAKDNKIYYTNGYSSPYLHSIEAPEKKGMLCGLIFYRLTLPTFGQLGLPTYVEAPEKYFSLGQDSMIVQYGYELNTGIKNGRFHWSTGDTTSFIKVKVSGKYWVDVFSPGNCFLLTDTIYVFVGYDDFKEVNFKTNYFHLCDGDSLVFPEFKADTDFVKFKWVVTGLATGLPLHGEGNLPVMHAKYIEMDDSVRITVYTNRLGIKGDTMHLVVYRYQKSDLQALPNIKICERSRLTFDSIASIPVGRQIQWKHTDTQIAATLSGDGQIPDFQLPDLIRTVKDTFVVSVIHPYCPEYSVQFELMVVNKIYDEDIQKQQCSGDSLRGEVLLPHITRGKVKWFKSNASFQVGDSGVDVFPDVFLPRSTDNFISEFHVVTGSDYCGNDTVKMTIVSLARPALQNFLADTIELCGGEQVQLPIVHVVPSNSDIYWKTDNQYAGLTSEGKGQFPYAKAYNDSIDHYTKIQVNSVSGTCTGDSQYFYVYNKRVPETVIMPNQLYCEGEIVPLNNLKKKNKLDLVSWEIQESENWNLQSRGTDHIPAFSIKDFESVLKFTFVYQAKYNACSGANRTFELRIMPKPEVGFYYDSMSHVQNVQFFNLARKYDRIRWYFGDGDSSEEHQPMHYFKAQTPYKVKQILNNLYCSDTLIKMVYVNPRNYNHIPTAFSPDQNDMNEGFKIFNPSGDVTFSIFNAWGEMLFSTTDNSAWDGTYKGLPCQQGVYLYVADVTDMSGDAKQFRGSVTLLR